MRVVAAWEAGVVDAMHRGAYHHSGHRPRACARAGSRAFPLRLRCIEQRTRNFAAVRPARHRAHLRCDRTTTLAPRTTHHIHRREGTFPFHQPATHEKTRSPRIQTAEDRRSMIPRAERLSRQQCARLRYSNSETGPFSLTPAESRSQRNTNEELHIHS